MSNTKPRKSSSIKYPLIAIWVVTVLALLPFAPLGLSNIASEDIAFFSFLLIVAPFVTGAISYFLPNRLNNSAGLLITGFIFSLFASLIMLDIFLETVIKTDACGSGMSAGNCFLIDGFGMVIYLVIFPILVLTSSVLYSFNLRHKK